MAVRKDSIAGFMDEYRRQYGYAPSIRDIAEHEQTSVSNVYRVLQTMIRDGELHAVAGRARTWTAV